MRPAHHSPDKVQGAIDVVSREHCCFAFDNITN